MVIGRITRSHGVRGAVRVRPTGPTLTALGAGDAVRLLPPEGPARDAEIASVDDREGGVIVTFRGLADRNAADGVRGALVVVDVGRLSALPDDEFYVRDMIGCRVRVGGRDLGTVREVLPGAANDVLEVVPDGGGEPVLVPFTRDALPVVDLGARRIEVREGLLDLDGA